ncbi:MAG: GNAT family N-acetyltransferase [Oscillospiraceae bacterium]|nr:GNAT family N-acetyltransferase [Oscillospiraceae bacterium]
MAEEKKMCLQFEELTHKNYADAQEIDRDDIPEAFVDYISTLMDITDYGVEHHCIGHTYLVRIHRKCIATILLGEAIPWETDPPQVKSQPFYRLMGFVIDKEYRNRGYGGEILEETIRRVYLEFGKRPIVLGCHKENWKAARFYERHGFVKTDYMEQNDCYFIRC